MNLPSLESNYQCLLSKITQLKKIYFEEHKLHKETVSAVKLLKSESDLVIDQLNDNNDKVNAVLNQQNIIIQYLQNVKEDYLKLKDSYDNASGKLQALNEALQFEKALYESDIQKMKEEHLKELDDTKSNEKEQYELEIRKIKEEHLKNLAEVKAAMKKKQNDKIYKIQTKYVEVVKQNSKLKAGLQKSANLSTVSKNMACKNKAYNTSSDKNCKLSENEKNSLYMVEKLHESNVNKHKEETLQNEQDGLENLPNKERKLAPCISDENIIKM